MKKTKDKKNILKKSSLIMCCLITFTVIDTHNYRVEAEILNKPSFSVTVDSYSPEPANLGEDIEVHGTIHPKPFEIEIKPKEIVLVLDTSGSMYECTYPKSAHMGDYQEQDESGSWVWKNTYDTGQFFVQDYCSEHRKVGKHLSYYDNNKIEDLKIAAQNFITKMEKEPNLKIGIVTFDTEAKILSNLTNDFEQLKKQIKDLSAGGGTNIGGGLRRAAYLLSSSLQQNKDANKSLVLMSDGEPNKFELKHEQFLGLSEYSIQSFVEHLYDFHGINYDPEYYIDITRESLPADVRSVTGYLKQDLEFATKIGEIIKAKGYNVYSIGYDLKNVTNIDAVATLKSIHGSMSNYSDNFFESDIGAIDNIFNKVAERILQGFVTDVKFNFDPTDEKIDVMDGNIIDLSNVEYIGIQEGNKIKYTAKDVPFTIRIQSKVAGDRIRIFKNSTISGKWQNENIEVAKVPELYIRVLDNILPSIEVDCEAQPNPLTFGQIANITYKIKPQNFKFNFYDSSDKVFNNIYLNFDLGEDFECIEGLEEVSDSKHKVKIQDVIYKYDENIKEYIAEKVPDISFKVRHKSDKIGVLSFKENSEAQLFNTISYVGINKNVNKQICTPKIEVISPIVINHGLYKGMDDTQKNIIEKLENTEIAFAKGSIITLGAVIDGARNGDEIILEIAKEITNIGNIELFRVTDSGIVEPSIGSMEFKDGKYTYTLSKLSGSNEDFLIRYSELVPSTSGLYTNYIKVGSSMGIPATVKVGSEGLPDLF